MCRRRDTPPLVRRAQEAVLALLSQVEDWEEGRARWPEFQEVAAEYRLRLERGLVRPEDLVITKVLSRPLDQFKVQTHTSLAAGQLQAAGIRLVPHGEKLRYIVRDRHGPPKPGCWPRRFSRPWTGMTRRIYLELLTKAVAEVLWPWESAGMPNPPENVRLNDLPPVPKLRSGI